MLVIFGGFVYWFGCSLFIFNFFNFNYFILFIFYLFIFLSFFSLSFLLSHVADRVLVLWPGVRP